MGAKLLVVVEKFVLIVTCCTRTRCQFKRRGFRDRPSTQAMLHEEERLATPHVQECT